MSRNENNLVQITRFHGILSTSNVTQMHWIKRSAEDSHLHLTDFFCGIKVEGNVANSHFITIFCTRCKQFVLNTHFLETLLKMVNCLFIFPIGLNYCTLNLCTSNSPSTIFSRYVNDVLFLRLKCIDCIERCFFFHFCLQFCSVSLHNLKNLSLQGINSTLRYCTNF